MASPSPVHSQPAHAPPPPAAEAKALLALHGPLAAAMERLVTLAASALRAPFAVIILTNEDRRCFGAGLSLPDWALHDTGAFWRSGIVELISAGAIEMPDMTRDLPREQIAAAAELGIGSLLGVPIIATNGAVLGVFVGAYPQPTRWNDDDLDMLQQFATTAAADYELRHSLAAHEANERWISYNSSHDVLTGLANRALLLDRLRYALAREPALRPSTQPAAKLHGNDLIEPDPLGLVAVYFLDVNDFRAVNERFGHDVGDQLLVSLGRRLRQIAGADATVSRLGGDEFAVLIERVESSEVAEALAERFRRTLAQPTRIGNEDLSLTVSIGIALSTTASELPEHILRGADLAMARAKRTAQGADLPKPMLFDWKIAAEGWAKRRLQDELRYAVLGDEFLLHYMPIIHLGTGRISGAEALLRWNHPSRGVLAPLEFLGIAEELDVINDVGRWVLRAACQQLRAWNVGVAGAGGMTIAVNLSARQFNDSAFIQDVVRTTKESSLVPSSLVLEVNERVVAPDPARATEVLVRLRALGAKIHMDDFGAGTSPLGLLQSLPLDGVKIDHALVNRMDRDEGAMRVVRSVVGLAREFGLDVVAEGISSASHLKVLQQIGCTHGQGQLFSTAVEASGVTAMLKRRPW